MSIQVGKNKRIEERGAYVGDIIPFYQNAKMMMMMVVVLDRQKAQ